MRITTTPVISILFTILFAFFLFPSTAIAGTSDPFPNSRFMDNGDGTITDNLTGLIWTKDANLMARRDMDFDLDGTSGDGRISWQHALDYVAKLNRDAYLGYTDWRLPGINEIHSLIEAERSVPALPVGHPFADVQSFYYWSFTDYVNGSGSAWFVHMGNGYVFASSKSSNFYIWPVRSVQTASLVH